MIAFAETVVRVPFRIISNRMFTVGGIGHFDKLAGNICARISGANDKSKETMCKVIRELLNDHCGCRASVCVSVKNNVAEFSVGECSGVLGITLVFNGGAVSQVWVTTNEGMTGE